MREDFTPETRVTVTPEEITVGHPDPLEVVARIRDPREDCIYRILWSSGEGNIVKPEDVAKNDQEGTAIARAYWDLSEADEGKATIEAQVQVLRREELVAEKTAIAIVRIQESDLSIDMEIDEDDSGFSVTEGEILHVVGKVRNPQKDRYKYRAELEVTGGKLLRLIHKGARFEAWIDTEGVQRGQYDIKARVYTLLKDDVDGPPRPAIVAPSPGKETLDPAIAIESADAPVLARTAPRRKKTTTRRPTPKKEGDN